MAADEEFPDGMTQQQIRDFVNANVTDSVAASAIAERWIADAQRVHEIAYSDGCYQQSFADHT